MTDITFIRGRTPGQHAGALDMSEGRAASGDAAIPAATRYFRIVLRWRWLILGAVALGIVASIVMTLISTPQYTATTRIEINREGARIVNVQGVQPETSGVDNEFYQTQYGLLGARALAERVARDLRLINDPDFFKVMRIKDEASGAEFAAMSPDQRKKAVVKALLLKVNVTPIRLSRLVDISWTSPDAALSARVTNAWAAGFIQSNLERRFESTAYARRFLERRLDQLRARLEESERRLVNYASQQAIINIPVGVPGSDGRTEERSLTGDSLAALNTALSDAIADRVRAQSRLGRQAGGANAEALASPALGSMRERRAEASAEYSRLLTSFEPGYPPARALAAQIKELDASIAREEARVERSLSEGYRSSLEREKMLTAQVGALKSGFLDQRRRSIQYNIFQREADTNRELYDGLLQRYKEIGVAGGVGSNNVAIVDAAIAPDRPSAPRPLINLLLGLLAGLGVGVGIALLVEQMDETISDPGDIEARIGAPLLGVVPKAAGGFSNAEVRDPKSGVAEAYLSIQTSLSFSSDHGIPRTVTVTSTRASEGKSTTAMALAFWIARGGAKTILVDADMRSPSVHSGLGLSNERGLSNYLAGANDLDGLILQSEGNPFAVLPAGPPPPNAAELLHNTRLGALLEELLRRYDHVVVDSPPVLGLADAPSIASATEATIFVHEAKGVKVRIARRAIERLRQSRAHLVGVVLTKFDARRAHFGYGYEYGYGYGGDERYGAAAPARAG